MNQSQVPADILDMLNDFCSRLSSVYGDGLISIVLYGSALNADQCGSRSNINLMIVLDDMSIANISKSAATLKLNKFHKISPVFMTEEFIRDSADVFPIEFLDIKDRFRLLFGRDILSGMDINTANLRYQCEHDLKSILMSVQKRHLESGRFTDPEHLLFKSFSSTLHIMRNLLRVKGIRPPDSNSEILALYEKELGVDTGVLNKILWAKSKKMRLSRTDSAELLEGLVKELSVLSKIADKLS